MRAAVLVALLMLAQTLAASDPLGPEFRVNTTVTGNQGLAQDGGAPVAPLAVAARDDGGFVVAWNQQGDGQLGVSGRVHARLYEADGTPASAELEVENGEGKLLDAAMAPDGAFVVVWRDFVSSHIEARRYTASGQAAGDAFVVSDTHTSRYAAAPCPRSSYTSLQVAMAADGAFVVLWTCAQGSANFPAGAVFARYYDGDGLASDGFVTLGNFNSHGFLGGLNADALVMATGYRVIFQGPCRIAPGSDTNAAPCAQAFNFIGESEGDVRPLGPQRPFGQVGAARPRAASDAAGNFVVVWEQTLRDAEGNAETRLAAQGFDAAASPIGNGFVFPLGEMLRNLPAVASGGPDGERSFVVAYQRAIADDPGNPSQIVAREFALNGDSPDGSFIAHSNTSAEHQFAAAAMDADGDYILAWTRIDNSQGDVYARRFGVDAAPLGGELRFVVSDPGDPQIVIAEANGSVVISVERVNGSAGPASTGVVLNTNIVTQGEALLSAPEDLSATPQPVLLNWADGESGPKSVSFSLVNDSLDEFDEIAQIELGNESGATAGHPANLRLIVVDDDDPPTARFATASSTASEGAAPLNLTAALSAPSGKDITLAYALSGSAQLGDDYTVSPLSPLVLAAGETEASITFTPLDDAAEEPDESILVDLDFDNSLNVAAGTQTRHTVTLSANDAANAADVSALIVANGDPVAVNGRRVLSLSVVNFGPNAAPSVNSQLRLDAGRIAVFPLGPSAAVSCERSNVDRTLNCAIPGGLAVNQELSYDIEIEAPAEPGEIRAVHSVLSGQPDPNLGNNDAIRTFVVRPLTPGVVAFATGSFEIEEGDTGAGCTKLTGVRRGGEGSASVGVRVIAGASATQDLDYEITGLPSGRLSFSDNASSDEFFVCVLGDQAPEDLESAVLELHSPSNTTIDAAASTFTFVILDDDEGPGDTQPDPFTLTHEGGQIGPLNAPPGAAVFADPFEVRGIGGAAVIAVDASVFRPAATQKTSPAAAAYSINDGAFTSDSGTVNNGDVVRLRLHAPQTPGEVLTATLTIGGVSDSLTVVTQSGMSTGGDTGNPAGGGGGAVGWPLLCALLLAMWRRRRLSANRGPA